MDLENGYGYGDALPEGCVANVLSLTSPVDACRLSLVTSTFRYASESDAVWERFLPSDYQQIISKSVSDSVSFSSKKELFLRLADSPILIDNGAKSFWLEKRSGKKCYTLSARDLFIVWGDTPMYWRWNSVPESRFGEEAELLSVCWLEIRGKISTAMLSSKTTYAAFFVFKTTSELHGFDYQQAQVSVGIAGSNTLEKQPVYLDREGSQRWRREIVPRRGIGIFNRRGYRLRFPEAVPEVRNAKCSKERSDGWLEVELGEFYNEGGDNGELEMSVMEVDGGNWKGGIVVHGIELRPK